MSASLLAHITSSSPTTHNDEDREEAANTWNLDVKERSLAHLRWKDANMLSLVRKERYAPNQQGMDSYMFSWRDKERITAH